MNLSFKQFNSVFGLSMITMALMQISAWYYDYSGVGVWLLLGSFWSPLIVCLFTGKAVRQEVKAALKLPHLKWIILGIFTGFGLLIAEQGVLYLWNIGIANSDVFYFDGRREQVWISNVALLLGTDPQEYAFFALNLFLSLLLAGIVTATVFIVGFEACWRGVVYRQLGQLMGMHKAPFFVGLLIAVALIPLHLTGLLDSQSPYFTAFVFNPVICIASSYVLAGLASQQSSAWPSAIALGIFFMGTHNLILVPVDATASLTAKTIVLVMTALWVSSSLKSRFESTPSQKGEILRLDHKDETDTPIGTAAHQGLPS